MKRILLFLLCLASLAMAQAQNFIIGDLKYSVIDDGKVDVSAKGYDIAGSVTIPQFVTYENITYEVCEISDNGIGFSNCHDLTSVIIPPSFTSIKAAAFSSCNSLTSIDLPNTITSIGDGAFSSCSSLTYVKIPSSVTYIGDFVFHYCSSLIRIDIPSSVTYIGNFDIYECTSLSEINVDSENEYYSSVDGVLFNKDKSTLIKYPAAKSGEHYSIPNSVTSVASAAFRNSINLKSVEIPKSMTSIADRMFIHCTNLSSINIPNTITSIEACAFFNCTSLSAIDIPETVNTFGYWVFNNSGLRYITMKNPTPPAASSETFPQGIGTTVAVPSPYVESYRNAYGWKDLNIIGIDPIYLSNVSSTTALKYDANSISGIQFDAEIPEDVELTISEEAATLMTVSKSEIDGGKTRYVAYTNNGEALPVDFILTASATNAKRGSMKFSNIIASSDDEPVRTDDFEIPVLGYALEGLTLPDVEEDSETNLSAPTELADIEGISVAWLPYSNDFSSLNDEGIFTATKEGTITDLPLQITDPLVFGPLNATAILNIISVMGDVDRSGTIDIADVVAVVNYILMRDPDPFDFKRADLDGSGDINIADLTRLVKLVLAQPKAAPAQRHVRARSAEGEMHLTVPTSGETVDGKRHVYVHLDTDREYTAMQVDLQTTGGARIASINAGPGIDSHVMDHAAIDPTTTRVLLYSHNLASLPAGDHIIDVTLADNNADEAPDAQILATSAVSADADGQAYTHAAASANIGDISTGLESIYTETMRITTAPGHITVEAPAASTVTITDLQGRTLGSWTGTGTLNLSGGLYIVSATNCRPQKVEIR